MLTEPIKSESIKSPIKLPDGLIAYSYDAAVTTMYELLQDALLNNREEEVKDYIKIIDDWKEGNEEERKAYKFFMWGPYKKLYKEAKKYLEERSI